MTMSAFLFIVCTLLLLFFGEGKVFNYELDGGAISDKDDITTAWKNGNILNVSLSTLQPFDVLLIPNKTFHLMGGIQAFNLHSIIIQIEGTYID